ncbi:hypothetical protein ABRY17_06375 [Clostridioides difficile]
MAKRLTGGAKTGEKIMKNLNIFTYDFNPNESEACKYHFDIAFGKQKGYMKIIIDEETGEIKQNTLIDCKNLDRPLGAYNDDTLYDVARMLLRKYDLGSYKNI